MTTVKNIYDYINSIAPFDMQEEWDNSGFLIGEFRKEVKKAVLALDATKNVTAYAAEIGADLIISHHPIIFNGLTKIKKGDPVFTCIENNVAVISAHTNFDIAKDGINDSLCARLGLNNVEKIDGTFINVGELDSAMSIDDFAEFVKDRLDVNGIRYTDTEKEIRKVAVGGGACEEFTEDAMSVADCFLTGDMKYHKMLDCAEKGFSVISAGHFETESESFHMLLNRIQDVFPDVEFIWGEQENPVLAV